VTHYVEAELVGNVWKVVASVGDSVGPADVVVILESMKMEIPVPADVAGVVADITVREGDVVAEGDRLAQIEPADG
jgi:acetyl-CoA carboxylase biotin carboxyl carrier protein